MSSDVYLYFHEDVERTKSIEQVRVGHLGVLHYFGFDAVEAVRRVLRHNPVLTKDAIDRIKLILRHARASIAIDAALTEEAFTNAYGYLGPHGIEWDDVATESEIEEELQPLIGKYVALGFD